MAAAAALLQTAVGLSVRALIQSWREALFTGRGAVYPQAVWAARSWMNSLKEAQCLPAAVSAPAARLRSMAGIHPKQHLAQDLGSRATFKTCARCVYERTHLPFGCEAPLQKKKKKKGERENVLLKWKRGRCRGNVFVSRLNRLFNTEASDKTLGCRLSEENGSAGFISFVKKNK